MNKGWRRYALVLALVIGVGATGLPTRVRAATVTANVFSDPTPGACAASGMGDCSLREAVAYADAHAGTTVTLLSGIYQLAVGDGNQHLPITADMTISGAGKDATIIEGTGPVAGRDYLIYLLNATVTLRGFTLRGGGSQYVYGGGIYNFAALTLIDCAVTQNTAYGGGGIYSHSSVTLIRSSVSGNTEFSGSAYGGGIVNEFGTITAIDSTISDNIANGEGGGAFNYHGTMTITNSTISGNIARFRSGGIGSEGGTLTITNSTISGNQAGSASNPAGNGKGGGILLNGPLTISFSTVTGNHSLDGGGGIIAFDTATVLGTIIAGNTASQGAPDFAGSVISQGYNLVGNTTGAVGFGGNDLTNVTPNLGILAHNGGVTQTHALLPGSPGIDAGGLTGNGCPATDQRGFARPSGFACDIGAFELSPPLTPLPPTRPTAPAVVGTTPPLPTLRPTIPAPSPGTQTPNPLPPSR